MALEYEDIDLGQVSEVSGEEFEKIKTSVDFLSKDTEDKVTVLTLEPYIHELRDENEDPVVDENGNVIQIADPMSFEISYRDRLYIKKPDGTVDEYYATAHEQKVILEYTQAGVYRIYSLVGIDSLTVHGNLGGAVVERLASNIYELHSMDCNVFCLGINDTRHLQTLTSADFSFDISNDIVINRNIRTLKVNCGVDLSYRIRITFMGRIPTFEWNAFPVDFSGKIIVPYEDVDYYKTKMPNYATHIDADVLASQHKKLYNHCLQIHAVQNDNFTDLTVYTTLPSTNSTAITSVDDILAHSHIADGVSGTVCIPARHICISSSGDSHGTGVLTIEKAGLSLTVTEDCDGTVRVRSFTINTTSWDTIDIDDTVIEA